MVIVKFICRDKLIKHTCIGQQQQAFVLLTVLISNKTLGCRVSFNRVYLSAYTGFYLSTIRLIVHPTIYKQFKIREDVLNFLST